MHDALIALLDKVDVAVAESRGVIDPGDLDPVARVAAESRFRLSYPETILVVAFAGGTGSGKSSLFNALAGEEVALTGGIRPMTVRPLALVPAAARGSLSGLLDDLGIEDRFEHEGPPWLCLLDLPDDDSIEVDHRHQVDSLIPRVDMVIWVTDPEKYRDASLHSGHIAPLSGYQRQFLFVLNQVDRMDPADVAYVAGDLAAALREDGVEAPEVIMTSAQPESGPATGVDLLLRRLEERRDERMAIHGKILTDLTGASSRLVMATSGAQSLDFEKRWRPELDRAISLATEGEVAEAGSLLSGFIRDLAGEAGGETRARLLEFADDVPARFLECVAGAAITPAHEGASTSWWRPGRKGRSGSGQMEFSFRQLEEAVDGAIAGPVRDLLARRARAQAAVAEMALAVAQMRKRAPG